MARLQHLGLILVVIAWIYGSSSAQKQPKPIWGEWTSWSTCTATCGNATRTRERRCTNRIGDESPRCLRRKTRTCKYRPCPTTEPTVLALMENQTTTKGSIASPEPMANATAAVPEPMATTAVPEPMATAKVTPEPMPETRYMNATTAAPEPVMTTAVPEPMPYASTSKVTASSIAPEPMPSVTSAAPEPIPVTVKVTPEPMPETRYMEASTVMPEPMPETRYMEASSVRPEPMPETIYMEASSVRPEPRPETRYMEASPAMPEPMPETRYMEASSARPEPMPETRYMEASTVMAEPMPESTISKGTTAAPEPMPMTQTAAVFAPWGSWSPCQVTCGGGVKIRTRECVEPTGGLECEDAEEDFCNTDPCIGDETGGPEPVPEWVPSPEPMATYEPEPMPTVTYKTDGMPLWPEPEAELTPPEPMPTYEPEPMPTVTYKTDGMLVWPEPEAEPEPRPTVTYTTGPIYLLKEWTEWSACDKRCGGGQKFRYKNCPTSQGGPLCRGIESAPCNTSPCSVAGYTEWGEWTKCDTACGGGTRFRSRVCIIPTRSGDCTLFQADMCNTQPCPRERMWEPWTEWTVCSATCGEGLRFRVRECMKLSGKPNCEQSQQEKCYSGPCVSQEVSKQRCGRPRLSAVPYRYKTLSSPSYSSDGPPLDCMWTIRAPKGYSVEVVVRTFQTEKCCEKLTLLEGEPYDMPYKEAKIATLSGNVESGTEFSTSERSMTVRLQRVPTAEGAFEIDYIAIEMTAWEEEEREDYNEPPSAAELLWRLYETIIKMFLREDDSEFPPMSNW